MSGQDAEHAVAELLVGGGLGLTVGTNLFLGKVRTPGGGIPAQAVFLTNVDGGAGNRPLMGDNTSVRQPLVLVSVRGNQQEWGRRVFAQQCLEACHQKTPTGWSGTWAIEPEPRTLGEDNLGYTRYTFTVRLLGIR